MKRLGVALCLVSAALPVRGLEGHGSYRFRLLQDVEDSNPPLVEQQLNYELSAYVSDTRLFFHGRLRNENRDELEPGIPEERQFRSALSRRYFIGSRTDAEVVELYADGYLGETFYRLGKQSIVWGTAFGLTVLDLVNPFSWREFILPDQDARRIALWSAMVERPFGDWAVQLVWVPDPTYRQLPEQGASFALPGMSEELLTYTDKPDDPIRDADTGLRLTTFAGGWDISLNYLYHYDDMPVVEQTTVEGKHLSQLSYYRVQTLGSALSNAFGEMTLRAEFGLSKGRRFSSERAGSVGGSVRADEFSSVVGVDYSGVRNLLLSAQLFSSYLMNDRDEISRSRRQQRTTFVLRRDFMNDTAYVELQLIHDIDRHDGLTKLIVDYQLTGRSRLRVGVDAIYGDSGGDFGRFKDRDRVYLEGEFSF